MSTQELIDLFRQQCRKIEKCRLQIPEEDLKGKYKKSFETLLQETRETANDLVLHAVFVGMRCWDCDVNELERELNDLIGSGWFRSTKDEAGRMLELGDGERVLSWLRELRQRVRTICMRLSSLEAGYVEDEEEYIVWQMTDEKTRPILETMQASMSSKQP